MINDIMHICNRGVEKRKVFMDSSDYKRFLKSIYVFNEEEPVGGIFRHNLETLKVSRKLRPSTSQKDELVELLAFNLLPNHYHLLLKEKIDGGIVEFMKKLGNGYTKFFNYKYKRSGSLFQGRYKRKIIESDTHLSYISAYINGNSEIHKLSLATEWRWSSLNIYRGIQKNKHINKNIILSNFKNVSDYLEYLKDVIKNSQELKEASRALDFY